MTMQTEKPTATVQDSRGTWIPIPLVRTPSELRDAAYAWCVNQAGEGQLWAEDSWGRTFDLVVRDGEGGFRGDWLLRYWIGLEGDLDVRSIYLLAKLA